MALQAHKAVRTEEIGRYIYPSLLQQMEKIFR